MSYSDKIKATQFLKSRAIELGFDSVGVAKAEPLYEEGPKLENWLKNGMHGKMSYMENHFDLRIDVSKLVEGAKSVVVFTSNYYPETDLISKDGYKIARYAYGRDYHKVLKKRLKTLFREFQEEFGEINGRAFVDSAPVMERQWAEKAGLGWIGKNSLLLSKGKGSYFFICELILDVELKYDTPVTDHCGTCTACIDACPTNAIVDAGVVDGSKCISYFTIELREQIPSEYRNKWNDWAFGCDICQEVCPWNRFSTPHSEKDFTPKKPLEELHHKDWTEITEDVFNSVFEGSAVKRAGWKKFVDNL